jgi:hypothetical protein
MLTRRWWQLTIPFWIASAVVGATWGLCESSSGWFGGIADLIGNHKDQIDALSTLLIAVFTVVLAASTVFLWLATRRVARATVVAADAANLTARAAVGLELPIVRAVGPELFDLNEPIADEGPYVAGNEDGPAPGPYNVISTITFRNDGRTPAFPMRVGIAHTLSKTLPAVPVYSLIMDVPTDQIIPNNTSLDIDVQYQMAFSQAASAAIAAETTHLWLYCYLTYADFLDDTHEIRFCWRWGRPDKTGIFYFTNECDAPAAYRRKE